MIAAAGKVSRPALVFAAFRLECLTVAWMVIEGSVAIGAGVVGR
jgi:hypothetical protein